MNLISAEKLKLIATTLSTVRAEAMTDLINTVCPIYGINSKNILEEFLATILHESGEFSIKEESLYYTTPARIVTIWPIRFNLTGTGGKLNANDYVRNPVLLANTVYNGRMGNRAGSNDGYTFRGRGFIQITGRESYEKYAAYKGMQAEDITDKLKDDWYALDSACWEYAIDKNLILASENDQFEYITKRINGGLIGWESRQKYYQRCKKYL